MNIFVHIERLILDGIPVEPGQHQALRVAVEAEVVRRLAQDGIAPDLQTGGAAPYASGGTIQLTPHDGPVQLGRQIGRAVYGGISR